MSGKATRRLELFTTRSERETLELAAGLAASFKGDEVVLLRGELGAGKTVFARGVAAGCGVPEGGGVASPSFTLINVYQGRFPVFHVDLYRLERGDEVADLGLEDLLGRGVVVVEWAEKLPFALEGIEVDIEVGPGDERRISVGRP